MFGCKSVLEEMKTSFAIWSYYISSFWCALSLSLAPPPLLTTHMHTSSIEIPQSSFSPQSHDSENIPAIFSSNLTEYLLFMSQGYFAVQVPGEVMDLALKESLNVISSPPHRRF